MSDQETGQGEELTGETDQVEGAEGTEASQGADEQERKGRTLLGDVDEDDTDYSKLVMPEDFEVDDEALKEFTGILKDFNKGEGLMRADAQKLVEFYNNRLRQQQDSFENYCDEMAQYLEKDEELGGANLKEKTIPNVMVAIEKYGDAELMEAMRQDEYMGNFPPLVRLLNKVGATLREDKLVSGKGMSRQRSETEDILEAFYGSTTKQGES